MNEAATSPTLPPAPTPAEIGAQMAKLREQFNLSTQEVSERLHIRPRYVSAIEEGRYDLMPGKVYARGYVHTYAEFLGLDADTIVAQCFVGELPANAQPIPPIAAARHATPSSRHSISSTRSGQWRGYAVMGAIALVLLLVVYQFTGASDTPKQEEVAVAPPPEAMLASVRNMVMPLPNNYACLTGDALLACFDADETAHLLGHLDEDGFHYGGAVDVSSLALAPPAPVEDAPETENPDSPAVATEPVSDEPATVADPSVMDEEQKNEPGPPHD